jgi:hypothetical protein
MRLQAVPLAVAAGALWGGVILMIGVAEFCWPSYGRPMLELAASIYPGYDANRSVGQVLLGSVYGFVDGAIGAALFAWIHNLVATATSRRSRG